METFHLLLSLPFIAFKIVILQCEWQTVILLALECNRFRRAVAEFMIPTENMVFLFGFQGSRVDISIPVSLQREEETDDVYDYLSFAKDETREEEKWLINRKTFVSADPRNPTTALVNFLEDNSKSMFEKMEKISLHLCSFLKPKHIDVFVMQRIDIDSLFVWDSYKEFNSIYIGHDNTRDPHVISKQRLEFFLEDVTVHGRLDLFVSVRDDPTYKYQCTITDRTVSRIGELCISQSDWVDFDKLFDTFNSPRLSFGVPTAKTVNSLLHQWINGCYNEIEDLYFHLNFNANFIFRAGEVLEGIETTRTSITNEQLANRKFCYDERNTVELKRRCDSLRATVGISRSNVIIYVWTETHLNQPIEIDEDNRQQ